jgi:hypothetical protein
MPLPKAVRPLAEEGPATGGLSQICLRTPNPGGSGGDAPAPA